MQKIKNCNKNDKNTYKLSIEFSWSHISLKDERKQKTKKMIKTHITPKMGKIQGWSFFQIQGSRAAHVKSYHRFLWFFRLSAFRFFPPQRFAPIKLAEISFWLGYVGVPFKFVIILLFLQCKKLNAFLWNMDSIPSSRSDNKWKREQKKGISQNLTVIWCEL